MGGKEKKERLRKSLESLIQEENQMISVYGKEKNHSAFGTTDFGSPVDCRMVFDRTCWRFSCLWAYRRRAAADKKTRLMCREKLMQED
mgnify:CR=1 FL=1